MEKRQCAMEGMGRYVQENYEFWQDRAVFVTGASGLVGGWVVKRLVELGADVVCLVRDWVPQSEFISSSLIDRVKTVRGDICDQQLLERALGEYEITSVIHLAAQTIVGVANANPISTFQSNITGTWTLLEGCRRSSKVSQIVVASSDKAYGQSEKLPYDESLPLHGSHPYDVSKSCSDLLAQSYAHTYDLPVVITRCGNFYGGGDLNWSRIVPGTIRSILRGKQPVIRSDGHYVRDYFYVEDGAIVYTELIEKLAANPQLKGEAFNFSNEEQIEVLELVQKILETMGSDILCEVRNEATYEIRDQSLCSQKARQMLNWTPRYSLADGLRKTVDWYSKYLEDK